MMRVLRKKYYLTKMFFFISIIIMTAGLLPEKFYFFRLMRGGGRIMPKNLNTNKSMNLRKIEGSEAEAGPKRHEAPHVCALCMRLTPKRMKYPAITHWKVQSRSLELGSTNV